MKVTLLSAVTVALRVLAFERAQVLAELERNAFLSLGFILCIQYPRGFFEHKRFQFLVLFKIAHQSSRIFYFPLFKYLFDTG